MNRLEALKDLVARNPKDPFARYGLGMAYAGAGDFAQAAREFESLLSDDPDYAAAYFHAGQVLEKLERWDEAKAMYRRGIEVTTKQGNQHARSELQNALDLLG